MSKNHAILGGIFFIGLGLLFSTHHLFPGILFLFGAILLTKSYLEGGHPGLWRGAAFLLAIGFLLTFSISLPLLFVVLGAAMLFVALKKPGMLDEIGHGWHSDRWMERRHEWAEKMKNEWNVEKAKNDGETGKAKNDTMYV